MLHSAVRGEPMREVLIQPFGFLPKFSTTVENTVENRPSQRKGPDFQPVFWQIAGGESRIGLIFKGFGAIAAQLTAENMVFCEAKAQMYPFFWPRPR